MPTDLRLALAPLRDEAEGGEGAGRLLLNGTKYFFFWDQRAYSASVFVAKRQHFVSRRGRGGRWTCSDGEQPTCSDGSAKREPCSDGEKAR